MKQLFPSEIIEFSSESHFSKHSKASNLLYIMVLVLLTGSILITPLIRVEVTTQSRGMIKTSLENNILQSAVYGEIEAIVLSENQVVTQGDTLVRINTRNFREQINSHSRKITENEQFIRDLEAMLIYLPEKIKTPKYLSEYNEYTTLLREQKLMTELLLHEKTVSDILFEKKVETEMEHLKAVNNYNLALRKERFIHDQYHNKWQAERSGLVIQNNDLQSEVVQLEEERKRYFITAPVTGTVIQYSGLLKGNFVVPNQVFAHISPDTGLLVECYVSPSDIGFLKIGTKARFQFDAFHYNQWGLGTGEIAEISGDLIVVNNQPVFKVRCSLNQHCMQLKNGYRGDLIKGMTLTARFLLTERSLSQLIFDKVDNWLNPKLAGNWL